MLEKEVLDMRNIIKCYSLNDRFKNYHEFINYFYKLSDSEKENIIKICIVYKKYNNEIKNGNIEKIYSMYKILLHKLEYNKLNHKEKTIYEDVNYYLITNSEFENNKLYDKYNGL